MILSEFKKEYERESLSHWLPWSVWDETRCIYYNADNTVGFILEFVPLPMVGENTIQVVQAVLDMDWPKGTIIQFIQYADPCMAPILDQYMAWREKCTNPFIKKWSQTYCQFLQSHSAEGISRDCPVPFRNFRVFMTAKFPCPIEKLEDGMRNAARLRESVVGTLKTGGIYSSDLLPAQLISMMHRVFNPSHNYIEGFYDPDAEIRTQIIEADTEILKKKDHLLVDGKIVKTKTPKIYNNTITSYATMLLRGDIHGSDLMQINCPFIMTLNLYLVDAKKGVERKANIVLAQKAMESIAPKLKKKQDEFRMVLNHFEEGAKYILGYLSLVLCEDSEEEMERTDAVVEGIFAQGGYKLQNDIFITLPIFLSSLPFGLYEKAIGDLKRLKPASTETFALLAPIQGDWRGTPGPATLFIGRRGQLMTLDFRDSQTNYNALIAAQSGGGKSFLMNYIIMSYLSIGGEVYVLDIGRSYEKICQMLGGQYVVFNRESNVSLNVFSTITPEMLTEDQEALESNLTLYTRLLCQMARPKEKVTDFESRALADVLLEAYANLRPGEIMSIEKIISTLNRRAEKALEKGAPDMRLTDLALMLKQYTGSGISGKWFKGPLNIDFHNPFVVLELEDLNPLPELREVVLLLLISIIDQKLYFSDRSVPKLIVIDEAWDLLGGANTAQFIETGYRRARKYGGSFVTITQSIMDFHKESNAEVGSAIVQNSAFLLLLSQKKEDIERAVSEKKLILSDFEKKFLETVRTIQGKYSEIFFKSDEWFGIGRLFVDDFTYILFNTHPLVMQFLDDKLADGYGLYDAIVEASQNFRREY